MEFDALILSRMQFAFTASFFALAATLSIGLAAWLAMIEGLWLSTGRRPYKRLYDFWLTLFAIAFALGCVSGIPLIYQLGTNWSGFTKATGNVLGPLLGYAVLVAVFLQASFLGIMVFGARQVGRGFHFLATCIVAIGTLVVTFLVLAANSWMHSPAGYELREGVFLATDWLAVIFNPSFAHRFAHTVLGAWTATAFAIAGVGAWLTLRRRARPEAMLMMKLALGLACILVPAQMISGHETGLSVYRTQPVAHAAIQGHWQTHEGDAPLILFAWPDQDGARNVAEVSIPAIGSLLATGTSNGTMYGLLEWPPQDRPDVALVFWSFRVMVGIGIVMVILAPLGTWGAWRGWIAHARPALAVYVLMIPAGFAATLAGWVTAEAGRQPFSVYGILRTTDTASPLAGGQVAASLAVFVAVYACLFLFGAGAMARIANAGPKVPHRHEPEPVIPAPPVFPDFADEDAKEEEHDEEHAESRHEDLDTLSDEELERLTAPLDEIDEEPAGRPGVSAHDRLFVLDADADDDVPPRDVDRDADDDFSSRHPHTKDREPNDGNP